jgi:hypothetical protein
MMAIGDCTTENPLAGWENFWRRLAIGDWRLEIGDWRLRKIKWRLGNNFSTGLKFIGFFDFQFAVVHG